MKIGLIGKGAIAQFVARELEQRGHSIAAYLLRPERIEEASLSDSSVVYVSSVAALPADLDHVIDCAGHQALRAYGPDILGHGFDLTTVSLGALAESDLLNKLRDAAKAKGTVLHLASGAIGALDALRSARIGELQSVRYIGRKPPLGWVGSLAETRLDLGNMGDAPISHFQGSAREAALGYPKNANVAAAVALAGIGFDKTEVELIADPNVTENIHQIRALGSFGSFEFQIAGKPLPTNPRSSALAAMSVVDQIDQISSSVRF